MRKKMGYYSPCQNTKHYLCKCMYKIISSKKTWQYFPGEVKNLEKFQDEESFHVFTEISVLSGLFLVHS